MVDQPFTSSTKARFSGLSHFSNECAKQHSMLHSRTTTFCAGRIVFGGFRVHWYASVSISLSGNSSRTASATQFTRYSTGPICEPSASAIAVHRSHSQ